LFLKFSHELSGERDKDPGPLEKVYGESVFSTICSARRLFSRRIINCKRAQVLVLVAVIYQVVDIGGL
jgi:hypothetical protein